MKVKAKIAHDKKTNELLGSSIQRDLITKLSPAELQQWINEHQTNMLEIAKRKPYPTENLASISGIVVEQKERFKKLFSQIKILQSDSVSS